MKNLCRLLLFVLVLTVNFALSAPAQTIRAYDVPRLLSGIRKEHPRLHWTAEDQRRTQALARTDPFLQSIIARGQQDAEARLTEPPLEYKLIGPRLLAVSRECLRSVLDCALTYRLTGDRRFADRARRDLLTVATFQDWHPKHYLDTAEMTAAAAIGYDWLYDCLTPDERNTIRTAIVQYGLKPSLDIYPDKWWATMDHNWNQVCNAGMTLGALAIAEDEPALSETILRDAVASIPHSLASYAPEGTWVEGPVYWSYATSFTALFVASLKSALGTDDGFPTAPGLSKTGFYELQTSGPIGQTFNYADGESTVTSHAELFWLAQTFDEPSLAWCERQRLAREFEKKPSKKDDRLLAMNVVWYDGRGTVDDLKKLPLSQCFHGPTDVAMMRSAWEDRQAVFLAFKGGNNAANHAHLDLGTFVLDANGQRWAVDLGSDDYNLPGYFDMKNDDSPRWKIFRMGTASHNTLLIGGRNQAMKAMAKITTYKSGADGTWAVADLSQGYPGTAVNVRRGVAMLDKSRVLVQDEVDGLTGKDEVRWGMVTPANIRLEGNTGTLMQNGSTLKAEVLAPAGAVFETIPMTPPTPEENQNAGKRMLAVRIAHPEVGKPLRIAVLLTPQGDRWGNHPAPVLKELGEW